MSRRRDDEKTARPHPRSEETSADNQTSSPGPRAASARRPAKKPPVQAAARAGGGAPAQPKKRGKSAARGKQPDDGAPAQPTKPTKRAKSASRGKQPGDGAMVRPNKHGVIVPRGKRPGWSDLVDPRDPPWEDRVAAGRYKLKNPGVNERVHAARRPALPARIESEFTAAIYRYSKGPDFTNDELGYGEVIEEEMWLIRDGKATSWRRISQRTKTGRQMLEFKLPDDEPR